MQIDYTDHSIQQAKAACCKYIILGLLQNRVCRRGALAGGRDSISLSSHPSSACCHHIETKFGSVFHFPLSTSLHKYYFLHNFSKVFVLKF